MINHISKMSQDGAVSSKRMPRTPGHLKHFIVDKVSSALSPKPKKMAVVSDSDGNMNAGSDASMNISDKEKIKVLEEKLHAKDEEIAKLRNQLDKLDRMKKCSVKLDRIVENNMREEEAAASVEEEVCGEGAAAIQPVHG